MSFYLFVILTESAFQMDSYPIFVPMRSQSRYWDPVYEQIIQSQYSEFMDEPTNALISTSEIVKACPSNFDSYEDALDILNEVKRDII